MSAADKDIYINAPELLSARRRTRDTIFTAIMWAVYLYLWVPLASLFAWLLGVEFAYDVMIRAGGAQDLGAVLIVYAVIVAVILATVAIWSLGNRLRYGNLQRRHAHDAVTVKEMAAHFEIEPATVEQLRSMRTSAIEFDDEGRPVIGRHEVES